MMRYCKRGVKSNLVFSIFYLVFCIFWGLGCVCGLSWDLRVGMCSIWGFWRWKGNFGKLMRMGFIIKVYRMI